MIRFNCQQCGKAYQVAEHLAGKRVACKACKTANVIPSHAAAQIDDDDAPFRFRDEEPTVREPALLVTPVRSTRVTTPAAPLARSSSDGRDCPGCGNHLEVGEVFCTNCGYDLKANRYAGTKVERVDVAASPAPAPMAAPGVRQPRAARRTPEDEARSEVWVRSGISACIFGVVGALMPLTGYQFRKLAGLGPYGSAIGAAGIGGMGVLMLLCTRRIPHAITGAIAIAIALSITLATVKDEDAEAAKVAAAAARKPSAFDAWGGDPSAALPQPLRPAFLDPARPQTPVTSVPDDLLYEGRPRIALRGMRSPFSAYVQYEAIRPPPGIDAVTFYRPCLRHTDPAIRAVAVDLIVKGGGDPAAIAAAVAGLVSDSDPGVRLAVIQAQGRVNNPATLAVLTTAMSDADKDNRTAALRMVAGLRDPATIDALVAHIADNPELVLSAIAAIDSPAARDKVTAAYAGLLNSSEASLRLLAIHSVLERDPAKGLPLAMTLLTDRDANVRRVVMAKLSDMKYEPAMAKIADNLREDQSAAAECLIKYGAAAEKIGIAKAGESDAAVRVAAIELLANVGTAACLPVVRQLGMSDDLAVSNAARRVWTKLAPAECRPVDLALADLTSTADVKRKDRGLAALATLPPDEAHQTLIARKLFDLLIDPNTPAATAAATSAVLKTWADKDVKDALLLLVRPQTEDAKRKLAIPLLADLKDARAIAPIAALMSAGTEPALCEAALRQFGSAAEDELIRMLRSNNLAAGMKAIDLLEEYGTRKCLPSLAQVALNARGLGATRAKEAAATINKRMAQKPRP